VLGYGVKNGPWATRVTLVPSRTSFSNPFGIALENPIEDIDRV
jgi:hypothetical protein